MVRILAPAACAHHNPPPSHPERPARLAAAVEGARLAGGQVEEDAPAVDIALVREVHAEAMLDPPRGWLDPVTPGSIRRGRSRVGVDADTFVGEGSWEAALRAAGAAVEAARSALHGEPAFALVRPPGHHATRGTAMGFCLLNNVAIAANALRKRVAIVDIDVHHGNGTQDVFYERDDVLYASLHGWPLYPGTGAASETGRGKGDGFTVNVPLPAGTDDAAWLAEFQGEGPAEGGRVPLDEPRPAGRGGVDARVLPAVRDFRPDVVLVSAGFDADARDPLGNLALSPAAFHASVAALREVQPRIAAVLEGGYDLDALREGVAGVVAALAGEPPP